MNFAGLAGGIVAVAARDDAQANELKTANGALALHGIAREPREVIHDEDVELMRWSCDCPTVAIVNHTQMIF
jgi:hypothetical protein